MWYFLGFVAVLYIGSKLNDIYKELRAKNPEYQSELVIKEHNNKLKKQEVHRFMHRHIGHTVRIQSDELVILGMSKLSGELKTVEAEWIELYQPDKKKTLYIKIAMIKDMELLK